MNRTTPTWLVRIGSTGWTRRRRKRRRRNHPAAATLNRQLQRVRHRADNPRVANRKNADSKVVNNGSVPTTVRKAAKEAGLVRSRTSSKAANRSSRVSNRTNSNVSNRGSVPSSKDKTTTVSSNRDRVRNSNQLRVRRANSVRSRSRAHRAETGSHVSGLPHLRVSRPDNQRRRQNRTDP